MKPVQHVLLFRENINKELKNHNKGQGIQMVVLRPLFLNAKDEMYTQ